MVFGHYPLDGQLRCFQHLTASTSSEACKLCLYLFYPGSVGCCTGASVLGHLLSPLLCTGVPISVCVCLNQGPSPASVASLPGLPRPSFSTTPALKCSLQALGAGKDCATPRNVGQGHPSRCCVWAPANCLTFRSSGFSDWSPSRPLGIK